MALPGAAAEVVALSKEESPDPDSASQSDQTGNGIAVTARQAQQSTPGTAEKNQRSDHGRHAQNKSCQRRRAAPRFEFARSQGGGEGP